MPVISHQPIASDRIQANGRRRVHFVLTTNTGEEITTAPRRLPSDGDYDAFALSLYAEYDEWLIDREVLEAVNAARLEQNLDKAPDHQTQAEYDRRVLGKLMLERDAHTFLAALPFFQAVESRGGANANTRASYLGIPRADYDLIASRFGDVQGAAVFLNDEKGHVWNELPEVFE